MYVLNIKSGLKALLLASVSVFALNASADIVISGTRIIYPESAKDVTVSMDNRGTRPLLVQTWLDDGRDSTNPQELKLPFIVTPPVSRVEPQKGQTVRITWLGQTLPKDKESLFWFNVLEVPPKAKESDNQSMLQLAFRTRIKLFFRPTGLKGEPTEAAKNIKWSQTRQGQKVVLSAKNDSPYYVSLASASLISGGKRYEIETHYIEPFSSQTMNVKNAPLTGNSKIIWQAINDYGGIDKYEFIQN
ncbi:fimbrial chaperone [Enterobacter cloacae]|uniref:fimbrial chaperone n=1 Tax=Enterobacter cloacae TaxID=550 RepID=UPI00062CAEF5|nr:fimbrial chaperone [Enterobacter cloacae]ELE9012363.1 fimbrial chaperone [Enterobacter cloacae]KKY77854.1 chaperone protein EcpD [Enterobacter cloacae]MBG0524040.1 fimbrial chaperone [Enterobacter cloacae]MDR9933492.1 fimbrial chaperone [Enterobacter cloacae subsp. dissolvens]HCR2006858.1 fimbrial chaperone [Enterobacter cloacae subsp. dissolvens]